MCDNGSLSAYCKACGVRVFFGKKRLVDLIIRYGNVVVEPVRREKGSSWFGRKEEANAKREEGNGHGRAV